MGVGKSVGMSISMNVSVGVGRKQPIVMSHGLGMVGIDMGMGSGSIWAVLCGEGTAVGGGRAV